MTVQTVQGNALEWEGGSIDDIVAMLAAPALAVRVEVRTPAAGKPRKIGEIHMVAGGVYETIAGDLRGDDAMEHLRGVSPLSFRLQPRLPNPDDGGLLIPGPGEGTLAERPPAELMRYCELYVLTCVLEIWRDTDRAAINYGKGEIGHTVVNGVEAADRLAEVINWDSGGYRIVLPELSLPEPQKAAPKAAPAPQPAKTMFGMPASQPVAVQTASPRVTPAAVVAEPTSSQSSTEVLQVSIPMPAAAPVAVEASTQASNDPAPAAGSIDSKPAPQVEAKEQPPAPKVIGRDTKPAESAKATATKAPSKHESRDQKKAEQKKAEQRKTEQRKTEQRKTESTRPEPRITPVPEPRKTVKSKIPEKALEAPASTALSEKKGKTEGSIWSAIGLGLAVGLACAAIYWIIRATGG
jgi:hypothetical protein